MKDWTKMITILCEKASNKTMVDKRTDEKECEKFKQIYNHYLDKRKDFIKSTEISYNEIFGVILGKDGITSD